MKRKFFMFCVLFSLTVGLKATTWFPSKHTCPICKHEHEYQEIGSYGGYIYQWESKYQYVYWPLTDSPSVYCCPDCYFSAYMWDFDSIPVNKTDTIRAYLATIKRDEKYKTYLEIPMITRLEIAENIYKMLGRDTEFWCKFYRVMGYHYDEDKNAARARETRLNSLSLARQMLSDTLYSGQEKENFFIMAAMYNFTGQKDSAMVYLGKADAKEYRNKAWKEENLKGFNDYLKGLISQYKELLKKED